MSAIYHFSAQIISRADGRSSVAAAAYRAAEKMKDERTDTAHDFTKKRGVFHSEIMLPVDAPAFFSDRATLWNAVEKAEKRKNSQLAREIDIALPRCLTHDQKIALAKDYVQKTFVSAGMIADVCFHDLDSDNPHLHVMLTTREVSANGFGNKNRDWNDRELLKEWRKDWASYANRAMENAGHSHRIDHRTLEAQGIDREPQVHLGPTRHAMIKKDKRVDSIAQQQERQRLKRAAEQAAKAKAEQAREQAAFDALSAELSALQHEKESLKNERIGELRARLDASTAELAAEQRRKREIAEKINFIESDTGAGQAAVQRFEAASQRLASELEHIEKDTKRGKAAVRQLKEKSSELASQLERAKSAAASITAAAKRAFSTVAGAVSAVRERRAEQRRERERAAALRAELAAAKAHTDALRAEHSELKAEQDKRAKAARGLTALIQHEEKSCTALTERLERSKKMGVPAEHRAELEALAERLRTSAFKAGTGRILSTQEARARAIERYVAAQQKPAQRPADTHTPQDLPTPKL